MITYSSYWLFLTDMRVEPPQIFVWSFNIQVVQCAIQLENYPIQDEQYLFSRFINSVTVYKLALTPAEPSSL